LGRVRLGATKSGGAKGGSGNAAKKNNMNGWKERKVQITRRQSAAKSPIGKEYLRGSRKGGKREGSDTWKLKRKKRNGRRENAVHVSIGEEKESMPHGNVKVLSAKSVPGSQE